MGTFCCVSIGGLCLRLSDPNWNSEEKKLIILKKHQKWTQFETRLEESIFFLLFVEEMFFFCPNSRKLLLKGRVFYIFLAKISVGVGVKEKDRVASCERGIGQTKKIMK